MVVTLLTMGSAMVVIKPVMVMIVTALGPVSSEPMSQSSVPPMTLSTSEQAPRVVLKPVYAKFDGGSLITRTDATGAVPMFRALIV